ncbi:MAG: hypothetical protein HZA46_09115 [Planctomycetales bacterium]|nr:hypothetical protein [Planctomycetales bacterium]
MSATEHHTFAGERGWLFVLIVSTLGLSWLLMQGFHEFGHVLHAWVSGGTVVRVRLHPLEISRTDVFPNPNPQFVAWGGAVWGSVIPLGLLAVLRVVERRYQRHLAAWPSVFQNQASGAASGPRFFASHRDYRRADAAPLDPKLPALERGVCVTLSWLVTFFAGFCLIANGGYLAIGSFDGLGDAGDLLNHGAPGWSLIVFGAVTIPVGLWLWHGLVSRLGLGSDGLPVSRRAVLTALGILIVVAVVEWILG